MTASGTDSTPQNVPSPDAIDAQLGLMQALYTVASSSPSQLNESLTQVAQALAKSFLTDYLAIHLYDLTGQSDVTAGEYPLHGLSGRVLSFRESPVAGHFVSDPDASTIIYNNADHSDETNDAMRSVFESYATKFGVIMPLRVSGTLIGALYLLLIDSTQQVVIPRMNLVTQMVANLLAVSIQNVQLNAAMRHQVDQIEQIAALGRRITITQDQNLIIRETAALARTFIPGAAISVALHGTGEPTLRLYLVEGKQVLPPITVPYEQAWLRYAYESGVPLVLDRLTGGAQPDYVALSHHALPESWGEEDLLRAALIIPLVVGGQTIGTFNLTRQQANSFTPADLSIASQIAIQLAVALENVRLFSQTANQLRSERLRAQLGGRGGRLAAERVDDILLATLQQVGSALGAQRARVRLTPNVTAPDGSATNKIDTDPALKRTN